MRSWRKIVYSILVSKMVCCRGKTVGDREVKVDGEERGAEVEDRKMKEDSACSSLGEKIVCDAEGEKKQEVEEEGGENRRRNTRKRNIMINVLSGLMEKKAIDVESEKTRKRRWRRRVASSRTQQRRGG